MKLNVRHSRVYPDWGTPAEYVDAARLVLGEIDLDPASDARANAVVQASCYFTAEDDGLAQDWTAARTIFLNPPGGLVRPFWVHLRQWAALGPDKSAIWIGYSLEQLQTLQTVGLGPVACASGICFPRRRLAFYDAEGVTQTSPTHANYIAYFGRNPRRFRDAFEPLGEVL